MILTSFRQSLVFIVCRPEWLPDLLQGFQNIRRKMGANFPQLASDLIQITERVMDLVKVLGAQVDTCQHQSFLSIYSSSPFIST
jgi:hypothetical protein